MSKYDVLWSYVDNCFKQSGADDLQLTFSQIREVTGADIDHSFLNFKKELLSYGYEVQKISLKGQMVNFKRNKL